MVNWSKQQIFDPKLISQIFSLLYRQYDEINEVMALCFVSVVYLYSNNLGLQGSR